MNEIYIQYYNSPYGELVLGSIEDKLCLCDWRYRKQRLTVDRRLTLHLSAIFVERPNGVLDTTVQQLEEYFRRERKLFDIPHLTVGTDFQKSVWRELVKVPYGLTRSYLQLAESIESRLAVRAVAAANGANAISIIVPCHRIVGSNGELTGYAGGLRVKEKLLNLEQDIFGP